MGKNKSARKEKKNDRQKQQPDREIDEETAAQVKEVEERLQNISQEIKEVEEKQKMCIIETKRAQLTRKQLEDLPDESILYRQVGRAFMKGLKKEVVMNMQAQEALKQIEGQQFKQKETALQHKVKGEAMALRELIGEERMKKLFEGGQRETIGLPAGFGGKDDRDAVKPLFAVPKADVETDESTRGGSKSSGTSSRMSGEAIPNANASGPTDVPIPAQKRS